MMGVVGISGAAVAAAAQPHIAFDSEPKIQIRNFQDREIFYFFIIQKQTRNVPVKGDYLWYCDGDDGDGDIRMWATKFRCFYFFNFQLVDFVLKMIFFSFVVVKVNDFDYGNFE